MGVGTKTMVALSIFFWLPFSLLGIILFSLFQAQFEEESTAHIKLALRGAKVVYEERAALLRQSIPQLAQRADFRQAVHDRDQQQLQRSLLDFSREAGFVTTLMIIDGDQRVVARRGDKFGDLVNLGEVFSRAVLQGELASATELVSRDFLVRESSELANMVSDVAVVQFVATPVRYNDRVVGAVVAGILLTANPWLSDNVFDRLGVDFTLFAGKPSDGATLHLTSSRPTKLWVLGQVIPKALQEVIPHGKPYYGPLDVAGVSAIVAFEPVRDSRNRIIGAIGVSSADKGVDSLVVTILGKGLGVAAIFALILSLLVTYLIRNDITRPLNLLVQALKRFGEGDLDFSVRIETGDQFEALGEGFNGMAKDVFQREERLKKHNAVAKLLMSTLDLNELLQQTLGVVVEITESQMGVIYLWNDTKKLLVPHTHYGTRDNLASMVLGEGYPGQVAKDQRILIVPAISGQPTEKIELGVTQCLPREVAYIPLVYKEQTIGVLLLGSVEPYKKDVVELFSDLADQISIALDNAIMHGKIQEISVTDGLTGLYNRRFINERLDQLWSHAVRHNEPLTVILSDIDDFKSVNDTYGHDRGDDAICQVANYFCKGSRNEDLVARYGGEEFVIVLPNTDSKQAMVLAERIAQMAREHNYDWADRDITLSIGVASFPLVSAQSHLDLVRLADQAMYKAKMSGKDQVVLSDGA
ncbi:MAG: diguanylate cyclase [Candidatus Polarisedimenticolaceae bacterium]|nr:diguanylate cyclase [Candidatus Polarisedimenticolaceae bacterium]